VFAADQHNDIFYMKFYQESNMATQIVTCIWDLHTPEGISAQPGGLQWNTRESAANIKI
jgi:hypothetical protein